MRVFVGVPCGSGVMTGSLAGFLRDLPPSFRVGILEGYSPRPYARNVIAGHFLAGSYDKLWFIDADCVPSANALDLFDVDADIVGGTYPKLTDDGRAAYLGGGTNGESVALTNEVVDIGFVPFGACVIDGALIRDDRLRLADDINPPSIFQDILYPNGKIRTTDDVDFCVRAGRLGYSVKCHGGVRFGHRKEIDLRMLTAPNAGQVPASMVA